MLVLLGLRRQSDSRCHPVAGRPCGRAAHDALVRRRSCWARGRAKTIWRAVLRGLMQAMLHRSSYHILIHSHVLNPDGDLGDLLRGGHQRPPKLPSKSATGPCLSGPWEGPRQATEGGGGTTMAAPSRVSPITPVRLSPPTHARATQSRRLYPFPPESRAARGLPTTDCKQRKQRKPRRHSVLGARLGRPGGAHPNTQLNTTRRGSLRASALDTMARFANRALPRRPRRRSRRRVQRGSAEVHIALDAKGAPCARRPTPGPFMLQRGMTDRPHTRHTVRTCVCVYVCICVSQKKDNTYIPAPRGNAKRAEHRRQNGP